MIFGGLEFVAGGYLVHRHYKHKNEKKRQADEAEARRHSTFPGASSAHRQQQYFQQQPVQYQQPVAPQQKYACYATTTPRPQYQQQQYPHHAQLAQPRPKPPRHAQTFNIPRRPVPERKPEIIIQPSLQRTDSFATISRMPIANGSRPQNASDDISPTLPPRHNATGLQPATPNGIYGNAGFSMSTPAFGATPTSPGLTYTMATDAQANAMHTVDDNWETYGQHQHQHNNRFSYAPTVSTQLGERDPPPPYTP